VVVAVSGLFQQEYIMFILNSGVLVEMVMELVHVIDVITMLVLRGVIIMLR
jgi:hypothetical protein